LAEFKNLNLINRNFCENGAKCLSSCSKPDLKLGFLSCYRELVYTVHTTSNRSQQGKTVAVPNKLVVHTSIAN